MTAVAHIYCPHCERVGSIYDPETVKKLQQGWRPARYRCGSCGRGIDPARDVLRLSWDSGVNPGNQAEAVTEE